MSSGSEAHNKFALTDAKGEIRLPYMIAGFVLLCALLATLILLKHVPLVVMSVAGIPLVWAAVHYSRRILNILTGIILVALVVAEFANPKVESLQSLYVLVSLAPAVAAAYIVCHIRSLQEQARQQFHITADLTHHFEYWQKADGSFAYVSPACESITGYNVQEFLENSRLLFDIVLPIDRRKLVESCDRISQDSQQSDTVELRITHRDGQLHWLEHSCRKIFSEDGEYLGKRASIIDITNRKNSEDSFRNSAERLAWALEGTEDGVWDADMVQGNTYFSPNYARTLGLAPEKGLTLKDLHALIHPDDLPRVMEEFRRHLQGKNPTYRTEYRVMTHDGEWRWILDRGKVIQRDRSGKPLRMVGTHVDITDRKKVEVALSESETKFRQLAENMREVFWLRDRDTGQFIYVNPAYEHIWGRSCQSLYQAPNTFFGSIHRDDLGRIFHAQKELVESEKTFNEEYRIVHPDGAIRWVWVRAYPIHNEEKKYYRIAGVAEDITERKKAETALKDSEKRYKDLIEQQGGGVGIIDPNETIVYINPAGEDIFGVNRGTLSGHNLNEFLDEEHLSFFQGQSSLRRQGVEISFEIPILRADKQKRNLLVTATPRFDVNGQFLGTIIIFRDITQRKQTEDRLRYISLHDALTGLHNRAFFEEELARLEDGSQFPVSIIMIDVDGLKTVNDQLGHAFGDQLLIRVAQLLQRSLRGGDIVARLGGDEFAILLPETPDEVLENVINRIYENVRSENEKARNPFEVSLSLGGITCRQREQLRDGINQADALMYESKQKKKNGFFIQLPTKHKKE
jgi:diguanylate cyclase (GGDEF)-like protein/PAS domain S-box-containing protein